MTGTGRQAIKFALEIVKDFGSPNTFLQQWLEGNASGFSLTSGLTFDQFCEQNPDEETKS